MLVAYNAVVHSAWFLYFVIQCRRVFGALPRFHEILGVFKPKKLHDLINSQ